MELTKTKKALVVIVGFFMLLMILGGSSDSQKKSTAIHVETKEITSKEVATPQVYKDDAVWLNSISTNTPDLADTLSKITTSISNGNLQSLQGYSEYLMLTCDYLLKENANFSISPKFIPTNKEWVAGLEDYYDSGTKLRTVAIDAQNGKVNKAALESAADYMKKGNVHIQKANELLQEFK